jgi:phospholipase C
MAKVVGVLLLVLLCTTLCNGIAGKIKHVIVLMEENRSFDHMFGFYPGVDGLKGNECNYLNTSDTHSKNVCVNKVAPYINPCDPDHSTPATTWKIFGAGAKTGDLSNATMSGFVEWEEKRGVNTVNYCDVMAMNLPEHVPIISALASEFALFDRFFCAHPGPTWPNRLYTLSGTSAGDTETGTWYQNKVGQLYPQKTFFDQLADEGLPWKLYFNDTCWELNLASVANNPEHLEPLTKFYEDARTGNLPAYAWINPRSGFNITLLQGSNDQHPDHDVALGEALYKDIYEALRASPQWNETLFIITYDEHGGFYDHVPPPQNGIPAPEDGEVSYPDKDFKFDRLGVRIPTLLISPWIQKGMILGAPPTSSKPTPTSEYTLTSIMATVRKLLDMKSPALTKRDAWSATFEQVFNLTQPRTDCPIHLPPAPAPAANYDPVVEMNMPVNDLQKHIMTIHAHLAGVEYPSHIKKQGQVSEWLQKHFNIHKERTLHWKKSKAAAVDRYLGLHLTSPANAFVEKTWVINKHQDVSFYTLATKNVSPAICLDYGTTPPKEGNIVTFSNCYPSPAPLDNRDPAQQWLWHYDSTIRPAADPSLCLAGAVLDNPASTKVYLADCSSTSSQKYWAWHGDSDNDYAAGGIVMSEWTLGILNATVIPPPTNYKIAVN